MNPSTPSPCAVSPEQDTVHAFVHDSAVCFEPTGSGPLNGLRLGVKDLFDLAGQHTGFGNPHWRATHPPPARHAPAVARLLAQGAWVVGKTHTDELAFSLSGDNHHYGAPINPAAPDRITGGSSSGSAAAVAAGLCDIALGTDTGGSVRAPASFCGLFGFRPTHDAVSREGVCALAPSFDTVGWFARDGATLRRVGEALLPPDARALESGRHAWAAAPWSMVEAGDAAASRTAAAAWAQALGPRHGVDLAVPELEAWFNTFRTLQFAEVARELGPWIDAHRPLLGPGIRERVAQARALTPEAVAAAASEREAVRERMAALFEQAPVLVLPTVPGAAPLRGLAVDAMERYRRTAMRLLCVSGLIGCPQVSLPLLRADGWPMGLSLLSPPGTDRALLALAERLTQAPSRAG